MIIGEIRRYLRDNNAIRVSRSMRDLAYRAMSAKDELSKKLTHEPSIKEIATFINEPEASITKALEAITDPISLYEPVFNDGNDSVYVMDQIGDTNNTDENWIEAIALNEALKRLNEREKVIIDLRFFKGKTQMEISNEIGISQAQVSRLEKGALGKIRKNM